MFNKSKRWTLLALTAVVASVLLGAGTPASAADARAFRAGRIIDDVVFTNSNSMSVEQIQAFLNSKMPNCDTGGKERAGNGALSITNQQWIEQHYNTPPPYRCLNDYRENPNTADNNYGSQTNPAGSLSAAEIIYKYSKQFNINPQVILVTLQKENSLVTDNIPIPRQYQQAMGFGCPDNIAPGQPVCDPAYNSFSNQVYQAARHFRAYIDRPSGWWIPFDTGWHDIMWSPTQPTCGSGPVYIENRATAALYSYTPYQPNQASINAQYGQTSDPCYAYGNRNFYLFFTDWFGSTLRVGYTPVENPRWMRLKNPSYKKDLYGFHNVGFELWRGLDVKFVDKVFLNNQLYLRTEYDKKHNIDRGVLFSQLEEVNPIKLPEALYMRSSARHEKINPVNDRGSGVFVQPGADLTLTDSLTVDGSLYYRTSDDSVAGRDHWIKSDALKPILFTNFEKPRIMVAKNGAKKINPYTGVTTGSLSSNMEYFFDAKIYIDGQLYYRTAEDSRTSSTEAVHKDSIREIEFTKLDAPQWMTVKTNTVKVDASTGLSTGYQVSKGRVLLITDQISVGDVTYYRTEFDSTRGNSDVMRSSSFENTIEYVPAENPRVMELTKSINKINPFTGRSYYYTFPKGLEVAFNQKIFYNNKLYLRSNFDSAWGNDAVIPYDSLEEL